LIFVGCVWGVLALLLGGRAFGDAIWIGILGAPLVALVVGALLQPRFEGAGRGARRLIALVSLYGGGTLFAVMIGLGGMLGLASGNRRFPAAIVEPVLGTWWGMTLTGFVLVLWPLAYATHWWLEWRTTTR
jgi:hypothetical protein